MGHLLAAKQQLTDPGDWEMSPEWCGLQFQAYCCRQALEAPQSSDKAIDACRYGTQGGGWGRDAGTVAFHRQSEHGNGQVCCTAEF